MHDGAPLQDDAAMLNSLLDFVSSSLFLGAIAQGLCYAAVGCGVYITFRTLAVPDLTIEGSLPLGAGLSAVLLLQAQWSPWLTLPVACLGGALAGMTTGWVTTRLKIPGLLASILVSMALYTVNLRIMGNRSNLPLLGSPTIFASLDALLTPPDAQAVIVFAVIMGGVVLGLQYFLHTEVGLAMRATGANVQMVRAQGVNPEAMQVLGLALSNGLVALCGAMLAQYLSFADVNLGLGVLVTGLASVIIGETLFRPRTTGGALLSLCGGSMLYRLVIACALRLDFALGGLHVKLDPLDVKLATAVLVIIALSSHRGRFFWFRAHR
jgi:putative tryptophan/tyrosine transport system permease protein